MKKIWIIICFILAIPIASAFSGSSTDYKLYYGIGGMGLAEGNSTDYRVRCNLLYQPVGKFQSTDYKLYLGFYYLDLDRDGAVNNRDNCPTIYNPGQEESDKMVVDDFDDGVIKDIWQLRVGPEPGANISESGGVMNIDVPSGGYEEYCLSGEIITKNLIIHGDFDVQVDFILNPNFHNKTQSNAGILISDSNENNQIDFAIRDCGYTTFEKVNGEIYEKSPVQPSDHLTGKFRVIRTNDTITTYYLEDDVWVEHASWISTTLPQDLKIMLKAWSCSPEFPSVSADFDNLIAKGDIDPITTGDGFGNVCDNCWYVFNPDQNDTNGNCPLPPYLEDPVCGDACEVVTTTTIPRGGGCGGSPWNRCTFK